MQPGDIIANRYKLEAILGEGGLGVVWRAARVGSVGHIAIKFLKDADAELRRRFAVEARALSALEHAGCVRMLEFGQDGSVPFLVTELLQGTSLAAVAPPLPIDEVFRIAESLADTLAYAHEHGVVHRDLKPANIFVLTNGAIKVLDFGIAKLLGTDGPGMTETGEFLGTPDYISPEQATDTRSAGPPSDQYSLGVILFELVQGHLPFRGTTIEICMAHLTSAVPPISRPDCPTALAHIVVRLMSKEPTKRFRDCRELREALAAARAGTPLLGAPAPVERPPRMHAAAAAPRQPPLGLAAAALVAAVAAAAAIIVFMPRNPNDEMATASQANRHQQLRVVQPPPLEQPPPQAADVEVDAAQPDVADVPAAVPDPSPGCAGDAPVGEIRFEVTAGRITRDVWVRLPDDYDHRPVPSVTAFTYRRKRAVEYVDDRLRADRILLESGFAIVGLEPVDADFEPSRAPEAFSEFNRHAPPHEAPWEERSDPKFVRLALAEAGRRVCLDNSRRLAIGHAEGARMLRQLMCDEHPFPFRATVLSGWAAPKRGDCAAKHQVATLRIAGLDDPFVPFGGGAGCAEEEFWSADETDRRWREPLGCTHLQQTWNENDRCTYAACARAEYVSCSVAGGHYLQDSHYNSESRTVVQVATGMFGDKRPTWFDPPGCGVSPILELDFEALVLPFLQRYSRASSDSAE